MSEYTPTTDEVRDAWWFHILEGIASTAASDDADWKEERALAQFDRWLAAHDAQVREECAKVVREYVVPYPYDGWAVKSDILDLLHDPEPTPSDGPDYHEEHAAWSRRSGIGGGSR